LKKSKINILLKRFNLNIVRYEKSPFEYLLYKPRYSNNVINFLGKKFEIADGSSFYWSHREIFIDEIYKFTTKNNNPVIIDCGSNYGTSILYFKHLYPDSIINGIEADPYIFDILRRNIDSHGYKNITIANKAISNQKGAIRFYSEGADGGRTHNFRESKDSYEVETLSLDDLIKGEIDFLKMDIEGSETDVLCSSQKLDKVHQLFIEYHSFENEDQKLNDLLSCLSQNGFRYFIQSQFCPKHPLLEIESRLGMDLQLNIWGIR